MKSEIFIRTDGNPQIGLGHLVRCTALAYMVKDDFEITFVCRGISKAMATDLQDAGFGIRIILHEAEFLKQLNSSSIAVLDIYQFDTDYQKQIKASGAKLVCIDDLHDKEFVADLIINHTPGIKPEDYRTQAYTQFALGLEYTLLRPLFLEQAKKPRNIEKVETVLICFGGSDPKNLTQIVLQVVIKFAHFKKIIVVTGEAYSETNSFKQLIASNPRIDQRYSLNEQQMLGTMLESDLAIVPASGILFEILATGCIVISGSYVDNQEYVYENFKNARLFIDAGNFSSKKLYDAISEVSGNSHNGGKTFDGQAAKRILKLFKQLNKEFLINLRWASIGDLDFTFGWATNTEIRRFSFQQHQITKEEHVTWFERKLMDTNCYYYIVDYDRLPIGSIRFDIEDNEAIVSFQLDPMYHGQGFGQIILKKGVELLMNVCISDLKLIRVISGEVLKNNIPSIKSFERMGFVKKELMGIYKFEKWI